MRVIACQKRVKKSRVSSNETTMIADNLSVNEIEDAVNLPILRVIFYEKVAHHQLFSTESFISK